jgi:hypothetical protein
MGNDAGVSADLSPLGSWATQVHELYLAMQGAGFTATEALTLITGMLATTPDED